MINLRFKYKMSYETFKIECIEYMVYKIKTINNTYYIISDYNLRKFYDSCICVNNIYSVNI